MDESRKQRDEFEKWWEDEGWDKKLLNVQGVMFNRIKTGMFTAWQASRAAIEIEMPEPFKLAKSSSTLTYYYQDEVDAVLSCAGIKVKE